MHGPTLHPNSSFEAGLLGWNISLQNGATGNWNIDTAHFKGGRSSLKLTKTNAQGYLLLKSTFPITIPAGRENVTWRGWFHADDAVLSSLLLFRLVDENGNLATDIVPTNSDRWESQSLLRNAPAGVWEKRLITLGPSDKERRYYMEVAFYGNPATIWLDELNFPATPWSYYASDPVPSLPVALEPSNEAKAISADTAKVLLQDGRATLQINNQQTPPVLHFPFVPERGDYAAFEQAGVSLQTVLLEINDSDRQLNSQTPQTAVWPTAKTKTYHFESLLQRVAQAAAQAPHSKLILNFHVMWPRDYVAIHPNTQWLDAQGAKGYGNWLYFSGFAKELPNASSIWWPSPYLREPLQDAADVIRSFMQQLQRTPYANQVIGCFISGGQDGQFYIQYRDYSKTATTAWQEWLQHKYGTIEHLNLSWQTSHRSFAQIAVPPEHQAHQTPQGLSPLFYDPATETNQHDYEEYRTERMWRIKEVLLRAANEGLEKQLIGLTWNLGGALNSNIKPLLDSTELNGMVVQPDYAYRMPGYVGGVQAAYRSFATHGKLLIKEMDTRSWIRETYNNEISNMKISTPMSFPWFKDLFRKETGQAIAEDAGWWYYDISGNAFRNPDIMAEVAKEQQLYTTTLGKPRHFAPQTALVYCNSGYLWSRTTHYGFRKMAQ